MMPVPWISGDQGLIRGNDNLARMFCRYEPTGIFDDEAAGRKV
jgi:hypothetical protein